MPGKQAVVLIHGIGEQRPMENLRAFVDTVWTTNSAIHNPESAVQGQVLWSKPDFVSKSFELRRLTTIQNTLKVRTDFFEFYWAHMMPGNKWRHIAAWARLVLFRWPWNIPNRLLGLWLVLLAIAALPVLAGIVGYLVSDPGTLMQFITTAGGAIGGTLASLGSSRFIVDRVGDAARYLNAAPANINRRHQIRSAGIALIEELHARKKTTKKGESPEYDRIIIVGHSLGSVIGYDILTHAWSRLSRHPQNQNATPALDHLDDLSRSDPESEVFHEAQGDYQRELIHQGVDWRVSDFVTLGSPLTYAELLLASDTDDFQRRINDKELPKCPPVGENGSLAYPLKGIKIPNHAAVFGPTRWTNLYFPTRFVLWGDLISGPLRPLFGSGILDISLRTSQRLGFLAHTLYWKNGTDKNAALPHISMLRASLRLVE